VITHHYVALSFQFMSKDFFEIGVVDSFQPLAIRAGMPLRKLHDGVYELVGKEFVRSGASGARGIQRSNRGRLGPNSKGWLTVAAQPRSPGFTRGRPIPEHNQQLTKNIVMS
jgi:hypothetical protein